MSAMPDGAGGGIDVGAPGGSSAVAAELDAIFAAFSEREFQRYVRQRNEEHGPDAPASALPRTDAQRRFDALVEVFRGATTAEGDRDHGATDIDNARPRCTTHNRWKSQHGLTSTRHHNGRVVDRRADGSAMFPVGRRIPSDNDNHPDDGRPDFA
ncbi:MAG: hypothetical protein AAGF73_01845 [Actinomycetota bacterium]